MKRTKKRMSVPKNWNKLSVFQKRGYVEYYLSDYRQLSNKLFNSKEWLKMVENEVVFNRSVRDILKKIDKEDIPIIRNKKAW